MKHNSLKRVLALLLCALLIVGSIGITAAEEPELWVGGIQVTADNASDILGDGKVSFDFDSSTLTFTAKEPTFSGLHNGALIDSNMEALTIVTPAKGLSVWEEAVKIINMSAGALTVNGDLDFGMLSDEAEAFIGVEKGLTVNGNVSLDSIAAEYSCGIQSNGPVTINGNLFSTEQMEYSILADGPVKVTGTVSIADSRYGIVSTSGGIVCDSDVNISVLTVAMKSTGDDSGITVKGNATVANMGGKDFGILEATDGPITIEQDLNVTKGYGKCVVSAKGDITVGGNASIAVETYDVNAQTNKAMRSTEGSIVVTGDLSATKVSDSGVYAYNDIRVDGDVTIGTSIQKVNDYVLMAENGALTVRGKLTTSGVAKNVVFGKTGVTVDGDVAINAAYKDGMDPTGCYAINAPDGSVTVGGTVDITAVGNASSISGAAFGVYAGDKITIEKKWDVTAGTVALRAVNGIVKPGNFDVTTPEDGVIAALADGTTVTEEDRTTVAAHAVIEEVEVPDGYYLVGSITGWNYDVALQFAQNPENAAEYMLPVTLAQGDAFKAVKVEDGTIAAWYPDGSDNNYNVDADHAGNVTVYFRPDGQGATDWHWGYLYIPVPHTHTWDEPTYTWEQEGEGWKCTATRECTAEGCEAVETENGTVNYAVTTPATCETAGEGTYTATFTNTAFATQTKTVEIAATGHSYGEPTYTWEQEGEGWKCTAARECTAEGCEAVETENGTVNYAVTTPATCETAGEGTYTATFTNIAFAAQTKTVEIAATGHNYGEPTYTWAADNSTCTATRVCANDASHVETETANAGYAVTTQPTFVRDGEGTYTATFTNTAFATQTVTVAIPKLQLNLIAAEVHTGDVCVLQDGKILYRYEVRIEGLPEEGVSITGAQIFVEFDHEALALDHADTETIEWTISEKGDKLFAVWANENEVLLHNGDAVLTLYVAKKNAAVSGTVNVTFTTNTLNGRSALSFVENGRVVDAEAATTDGSITFDPILYGDANGDGKITSADAALILRAVVGLSEIQAANVLNADANGDGEITAEDAALILRYVVGLVNELPGN